MKNSKVFMFFFFLVFAIAFSMPAFFMIPQISEHFKYENIMKNGTQIEATVLGAYSNIKVNDEKIYYIEYSFKVDGNTYYGKTSSRYRIYQAQSILKKEKIQVKYDKKFNSCEADYKIDSSSYMLIVGCSIFTLADLGFWITEIVFIVQFVKYIIVSIKGKKYVAQFISINPSVIVNGTPLYKIAYSWIDEDGEVHDDEKGDYTFNEASTYEMVKEFNISACGNISKILDKPSKLIKRNLNNTEPEAKIEDYYECPYCGSIFNYGASRCYSCGAPVRKKQKNKS